MGTDISALRPSDLRIERQHETFGWRGLRRVLAALGLLFLTVFTSALANGRPSGGMCLPPALGAPCPQGGLATLGAHEPVLSHAIGNPVHLASGNKYQLEVDLPPNRSVPGLELVRHYNGRSTRGGVLGRNWSFSYDTRLQQRGGQWLLRQADGSEQPISAPIRQGDAWRWAWPDGRTLVFDTGGQLISVQHDRQAWVRIVRHGRTHALSGLIHRVEAGNHALHFHYEILEGEAHVVAVDTPLGRFQYGYGRPPRDSGHGSLRLESLQRPDRMHRLYHYEPELQSGNPYALTGISVAPPAGPPRRLSTWAYDIWGRVTSQALHGQDTPALKIDYLRNAGEGRDGITRITTRSGHGQDVHFQKVGRLTRILGRSAPGQAPEPFANYDAKGQLLRLGELSLSRATDGMLASVALQTAGWPGLNVAFASNDKTLSWSSEAIGRTTLQADLAHRPATLRYANGDQVQLRYDRQGRLATLVDISGESGAAHTTRLSWRGNRLHTIEHPFETETRSYDDHGHLTRRTRLRPALFASGAARFDERFTYDSLGRLTRHDLPEGGALLYEWRDPRDADPSRPPGVPAGLRTLVSVHWEDARGKRHTVITSQPGVPGYRYGNGLTLFTAAVAGRHADTLWLYDARGLRWQQRRWYDAYGRITADVHRYAEQATHAGNVSDVSTIGHAGQHDAPPDDDDPVGFALHDEQARFHYDARSRLQGATHRVGAGAMDHWWYAWHPDGHLAALRENRLTRQPRLRHDVSGLPLEAEDLSLRYGPGRRLESVTGPGGKPIAQYRHNVYGHRIVEDDNTGTRHRLYMAGQWVAEARAHGNQPPAVTRRYVYAGLMPIGMIEYPRNGTPRLYAVHADLSGAARMVTDAEGALRWRAAYSPTGVARQVAGDIDFPLRLPGQSLDRHTGWHDNLHRSYVPAFGHYLEPDPLGPLPGSDTYGYAAQQPWRYSDPLGLLLFSFDGTRYNAESAGNAWQLAQVYQDGPAHYHSGPGNRYFLDWDAVVAWQAGQIVENQWQALLNAVERHSGATPLAIDVIGFSRGAALARHFGNRIHAHMQNGRFTVDDPVRGRLSGCLDLRFMGLFDTVAQFGIAGSHNYLYDLGISEMWSWVAHAVALHEHRWAFPLTSADAGQAGNVVEAPFVGGHADIGGGVALHEAGAASPAENAGPPSTQRSDSDLAKVALQWMHWQAQAAGVDFASLPDTSLRIDAPVVRDMRSAVLRSLQDGDRAVASPSGALRHSYQQADARLGGPARAQVEAYIQREAEWRSRAGEQVGTVDMDGYAQWLEETLGWRPR